MSRALMTPATLRQETITAAASALARWARLLAIALAAALLAGTGAGAAQAGAATAVLVKDGNAGANGEVGPIAELGGAAVYSFADEISGTALWRSDGTRAGTDRFHDLPENTRPRDFTRVKGTLFFTAYTSDRGRELWSTDGTSTGSNGLVADIHPGPGSSLPAELRNVDGTLVFSADDGITGRELWKSGGSSWTTSLLKNINPVGSSTPQSLEVVGRTLFFSAYDPVLGHELWKSDGTAAGTMLVKDIAPATGSSSPSELTEVGGALLFAVGNSELWRSDGTAEGTTLVKDLYLTDERADWLYAMANVGGRLFFTAHGDSGWELWTSDGTAAGTGLVEDIHPGPADSRPMSFTGLGGTALFVADDGVHGRELWRSDGTAAGTTLVKDINPAGASDPSGFTEVGGRLYFSADDGSSGNELWTSDGTTAGTTLVKDIRPGAEGSSPGHLTRVGLTKDGPTLFFFADDGSTGLELWRTAESEPDTTPPEAIIDSGPSGTVRSTEATFEFHASEAGSILECSLDGGGFSSCTSPITYTGLAVGSHTFAVRATDPAGNVGAPASRSWSIAQPPSAPQNLVASTATKGKGVKLSWLTPASNGGSAITAYRIYRGTSSGSQAHLTTVGGTTTSYSDTATRTGVTYYYEVTAVNAIGEGPASIEASAKAR